LLADEHKIKAQGVV